MPGQALKSWVNLGCGDRVHPDWINIDIWPSQAGVLRCDLRKRIPLASGSCDVVYQSHVLEHLRRSEANFLLKECLRILRPGGMLRIVVPDLEQICRNYLNALDAVSLGDAAKAADHEWMTIELCDQLARECRGGEMERFLSQKPLPNPLFIYERIGEEGRMLVERCQQPDPRSTQWRKRLKSLRWRWRELPERIYTESILFFLGTRARRMARIGRFRLGGDAHQWMYDRLSLSRLLQQAGFQNIQQQSAATSAIPGWSERQIDITPDGAVIKSDSLFMEAMKAPSC